MQLVIAGRGSPTIVLEAGSGGTSRTWRTLMPELAGIARVVSYDRAGLGRSEPSPRPRSARVIAEELHDALRSARLPPPYVLVAHSAGGLYARVFAAMYPSEVVGVVLVDPAPEDFYERARREFPSVYAHFDSLDATDIASRPPSEKAEEDVWDNTLAEVRAADSLFTGPAIVLSSPRLDLAELGSVWTDEHRRWALRNPRREYVHVDGVGHNIHRDRPAVVLDAVRRIMASQSHSEPTPLAIGQTFTIESGVLGEARTINVYKPPVYGDTLDLPRPVLYMPDGGIHEDFLHIAGLLQISVLNGTMRPFLLVGIENTQRRRDLTGPTRIAADSSIAPRVGESAAFRRFIRTELMPVIRKQYRTTSESVIIGESLAGLFVVETLLQEPDLFDTYIAFDPSLWWNDAQLLSEARPRVSTGAYAGKVLYLASSAEAELADLTNRLADLLEAPAPGGLTRYYQAMPQESHGTIYHPAALAAFRRVFKPDN
jgi:predicted alpha/beta superfamily hydrolase